LNPDLIFFNRQKKSSSQQQNPYLEENTQQRQQRKRFTNCTIYSNTVLLLMPVDNQSIFNRKYFRNILRGITTYSVAQLPTQVSLKIAESKTRARIDIYGNDFVCGIDTYLY
jgi:hypothetical protein